jgi:hypothetical protein
MTGVSSVFMAIARVGAGDVMTGVAPDAPVAAVSWPGAMPASGLSFASLASATTAGRVEETAAAAGAAMLAAIVGCAGMSAGTSMVVVATGASAEGCAAAAPVVSACFGSADVALVDLGASCAIVLAILFAATGCGRTAASVAVSAASGSGDAVAAAVFDGAAVAGCVALLFALPIADAVTASPSKAFDNVCANFCELFAEDVEAVLALETTGSFAVVSTLLALAVVIIASASLPVEASNVPKRTHTMAASVSFLTRTLPELQ